MCGVHEEEFAESLSRSVLRTEHIIQVSPKQLHYNTSHIYGEMTSDSLHFIMCAFI